MDGRDDEHVGRRGPRGGVTVTGSGEAEAVPDVAIADLGRRGAGGGRRACAGRGGASASTGCVRSCATPASTTCSMRTTQSSTWTDGSARGSSRVVARLGLQVTLHDVAVAGDVVGAAVGRRR